MIRLLRSNLVIFLLRKFSVVWVYIDLPGVVIWQHIHPSMLHSYWEEGWQDSSCLKAGILLIYWNEAQLPYRQETSHSLPPLFVSPDLMLQVHLAGNHRRSLLVHLSSLHHYSLGSIHLKKLLSSWVGSMHPFAARVVDSHPYVLLHPSGGHKCLTRCRLQMFFETTGNHR